MFASLAAFQPPPTALAAMGRMKVHSNWASPPPGCHCWRQQQRQRRQFRARSFERSPLFESEIFQKEMDAMFKDLEALNGMIAKFGDFDIEGKKLFLEHVEGLLEKLKLSMARVRLAKDDPLGQEMLRLQAVQMLEANTNMDMMLQGMEATLAEMRSVIAREEATCDPAVLATIKREWEERFRMVRGMNVEAMAGDPLVAQGSMDPQALRAAQEVLENPLAAEKYRDNAPLYAFLKAIVLGQRP